MGRRLLAANQGQRTRRGVPPTTRSHERREEIDIIADYGQMIAIPERLAHEDKVEGQMDVDLLLFAANKHIGERVGTLRVEARASTPKPFAHLADRAVRMPTLMPWLPKRKVFGLRPFDNRVRDFDSLRVAFAQEEVVSELE